MLGNQKQNEIFEFVKNYLEKECSYPSYNVELDSNIKNDLSVDSLDIVDLIVALEKRYSIHIENNNALS